MWEILEKDYKNFLKSGKKIIPSGSGSSKSSSSDTDNDLFKIMGFLDQKYKSRPPLSSTGISINNSSHQSMWELGPKPMIEQFQKQETSIMPDPDDSYHHKKSKSNNDFRHEMKGMFSCIADLTTVIKLNVQRKAANSDDAYKDKINNLFQNLNAEQRDNLLDILLQVIINVRSD